MRRVVVEKWLLREHGFEIEDKEEGRCQVVKHSSAVI